MTTSEADRLEILAAAIEKFGFGRGLAEFDPGPAAALLRSVAAKIPTPHDTYNDYDGTNPQATIDAAAAILAPIFQANRWVWATAEAPSGVPSEVEIAACISSLFDHVTGDVVRSSTGRLVVEVERAGEPGSHIEKNIYLDLGTVYGPETHA